MFNHALATQAVAEAAGRSGNAYLSAAAQKGVGMLERAQGSRGGWGYQDRLGERQDTSVTSFAVQALLASREAGLQVKEETLAKALKYLQDATDLRTANVAYGFEELKAAGDTSFHPAYTGVALMLRQQLGEHAASPAFKILVRRLAEFTPNSKPEWGKDWKGKDAKGLDAKSDNERAQVFDPYRWYFATYGLFFYGGEDWNAWNKALVKSLLELQDHDGAWRANDNNTVKAGAPFSTALCILTLQVYYRIH